MSIHFEELWEKCEKLHKQTNGTTSVSVQSIMDELAMKINLYKVVDSKTEVPKEEQEKAKSRLLGEILLTLTHLSLREDVNVFEALSVAYQYRNQDYLDSIPNDLKLPRKG
jgi:predicted ABC-type exoprotein transport system permease subunit